MEKRDLDGAGSFPIVMDCYTHTEKEGKTEIKIRTENKKETDRCLSLPIETNRSWEIHTGVR